MEKWQVPLMIVALLVISVSFVMGWNIAKIPDRWGRNAAFFVILLIVPNTIGAILTGIFVHFHGEEGLIVIFIMPISVIVCFAVGRFALMMKRDQINQADAAKQRKEMSG